VILDLPFKLVCITPATFPGSNARELQLAIAQNYFFLELLDPYGM